MLLLSVDSSAVTASAALTENGNIIKSEFLNAGLTHSETLMPMIDKVMQGFDYSKLDAIAISAGPGSFTGVRIGVATVKGLAFVNNTPCIPVSTLEAAAYNFANENAVICAVMDARRMQFYNALFKAENGKIIRLCEDRAIGLKELLPQISEYDRVIAVGDGAELLCNNAGLDNLECPPGHMFVGYYTDNSHTDKNFLETTMIGDVDLDDFFPDEQLDSTIDRKSTRLNSSH